MFAPFFISFYAYAGAADVPAPISVDEAKAHLRVDSADQDTLISDYIRTAAAMIENATGIVCRSRSIVRTYPRFLARLPLRRGPATAVASVQYVDPDGALTTLAADQYVLTTFCGAPCIEPAVGVNWPATATGAASVIVTFTAGYASNADADANVRTAARLIVGNLWTNRDGAVMFPPLALSLLGNVSLVDIG